MPLDCDEIVPRRLWVGTYVEPDDFEDLRAIGITTIVNLQSDEDFASLGLQLRTLQQACRTSGIELRRIATPDFDKEALARNLQACVAELECALSPDDARVYVHCTAGINRSPTVAAAYLIRAHGFSAQEAYNTLRSRRQCSPYLDVLRGYAESLRKNP